jgi:hypothetical protein
VISRVDGRGGDDQLTGGVVDGGPGDDVVSASRRLRCGPGRDRMFDRRLLAPRPPRDCERIDLDGLVVDIGSVRVAGRTVTLAVERTERGRGRILLRAGRRTIGRVRAPAAEGVVDVSLRATRRVPRAVSVVLDPSKTGVPTRGFRTIARS